MVRQYLQLLPDAAPPEVRAGLVACAAFGLAVWAMGARFSRFLITLFAVALGGAIGMEMPQWMGWNVSGAGPTIGAAVVLGVSGFVLQGMWAGVLLGCVLALWATFVTWVLVGGDQPMSWPPVTETTTAGAFVTAVWNSLPPTMQRMVPFWAASGMVSGLAGAILWLRLTTRLAWSALGVTLVCGCGLAAVHFIRPEWVREQFPDTWLQAAILVAGVLLGVLIQSQFVGPRGKHASKSKSSKDSKESDVE